jgi:putative ABC transport system permease protein
MRALDIKLGRDLWHMKGQALAIAAVVACGVAVLVLSVSTLRALESAKADYYARYRFAEVFATLKRAPLTVADRAAQVAGVGRVEARIVRGVTLDLETVPEPAAGLIISLPDRGVPNLNGLHLREGRWPEPGRAGEVLAGEAFVVANGFSPGTKMRAVLNGRLQDLTIVGVALSPEYITQVQAGSLFPDDKRFGVFWMRRVEMESAFDMKGAFNDLTAVLAPGANEAEVLRRLDEVLEPYGGQDAYGRDDHLSHRFISDEIRQLKIMALVPPAMFMAVAAFLLNIAFNRVLALQREQVAMLKAFGYSAGEVAGHFIKLAGAIIVTGVVAGWVLGVWMGSGMTAMYAEFYRLPFVNYEVDVAVCLLAGAVALGGGLLGVVAGVRRIVALPPAEAMRPEAPAEYRETLAERLGLQKLLSVVLRMIVRELERRPMKGLMTALGIGAAAAILVLGNFGHDAINHIVDFQFGLSERQDATVMFHEPTSRRALGSLRQMRGVTRVEPVRAVPVRLRAGPRSHQTSILGLEGDATLYRLMDRSRAAVSLPPEGLVMSAQLAKMLGVTVGDAVTVEVQEGERPVRTAAVRGLVNDFAGVSAYMRIDAVNRMMREGASISGAYLMVEDGREDWVYGELKRSPRIASTTMQRQAMTGFLETFGENILKMRAINIFFACVIAVGVIYNAARISLSERSREFATMRVVGFTKREVSGMLLGEMMVVTAVGLPIGLFFGWGLCYLLAESLATELYRIPLVISAATYASASVVIVLASLGSFLVVRRRIGDLDLVSVLKSRE